jgi:hypothetical protein
MAGGTDVGVPALLPSTALPKVLAPAHPTAPTSSRLRVLGKRIGKASTDVLVGERGVRRERRHGGQHGSPTTRRRHVRSRFPTIVERFRRDAVVEELSPAQQQQAQQAQQQAQPGGRQGGRVGVARVSDASATSASTLDSDVAQAAAEAADSSLQQQRVPAGPSAAQRGPAVPLSHGATSAGAAGFAAGLQQGQGQGMEAATPSHTLNPVFEDANEGPTSPASEASPSSPPQGGRGPGTAAAAAPASPASDAQLLADVPLSEAPGGDSPADGVPLERPAAGGAAVGVAGGRVSKRTAGLSRFARCLDWRKPSGAAGSGPPPAPSAGAALRDGAAGAASTDGGGSVHPSPSQDSRTSSRVLLSDRVKRSELLAGSSEGEGGAAPAAGRAAWPPQPPLRSSSGDDEATIGLEAVLEGSSAGTEVPGAGSSQSGIQVPPNPTPPGGRRTDGAVEMPGCLGGMWWRREPHSPGLQPAETAPAALSAGAGAEEDPESPSRLLLHAAFMAWRGYCADMAWRRAGRDGTAPLQQPGSPCSEADSEDGGVQGEWGMEGAGD